MSDFSKKKPITDDEPVLISDKELAELEAADGLDAGLDDFQYRDVVSDLIPALITRLRAAEDALKEICNYKLPEDDWTDELVDMQEIGINYFQSTVFSAGKKGASK